MTNGATRPLRAELAERVAVQGRMASALVELERHPGHAFLTSGRLTGETARLWAGIEGELAGLWRDFDDHRRIVDAATAAADGGDLGTLRRLLHDPSIEVSRTALPLHERGLTGVPERVEHIDLDTLQRRMEAAFDRVSAFVTRADAAYRDALARVASPAEQLRDACRIADDLGTEQHAIAELTRRLDVVERTATTDPLGSTVDTGPLAHDVGAVVERLRVAAAVRDGWPERTARLDAALGELDALRGRMVADRARAAEIVVVTLPPAPADRRPALRARQAAVLVIDGWPSRAAALDGLLVAVATEADTLRAARELASGLIERRGELRGRYEAYRAKAHRLGRSEQPEILRLEEELRAVLWARPCDLAAATRALAEYQRLLQAEGRTA
ncbi:hypothetical protein ACQPZQ_19070 [Pseudonocardia sp. CA-142604]|uniref:hypothetical protein n=1 Tax=Pseudonocardia sp. CA-142604 TaxID=3240024 RepID=UPI003D8CAFA5